ncbi:DUF3298 and DUF4163 domain-containing protein [Caldalkalibacillus mannanilyticus]|uniref:DUF3298 and DUF4163 domain-containing protein n=1 Tax=Caldalkalibacillus mannanilyticus TaxID=1418 RepID=UPI000558EA78|nr:DUF3298 and DUF4163 domain-containing protein [Caldalkalibacillus mannanilyticus]
MRYQNPVVIYTQRIEEPNVTIYYPKLSHMTHREIENKLNHEIYQNVLSLIEQQQKFQIAGTPEITGHYEIKTNERGILSLTLSNYTYTYPMAHGYTLLQSLTFDLRTGKQYTLSDLFKADSNYVEALSKLVKQQIMTRGIPLLDDFKRIQPEQPFYLADKSIVLYFQLYEISPYYVGFPMFPISVYDILDLSKEDGPLSILAADIA